MAPDFSVAGKVFVITGGSGVLCSAMARCVAQLGANVAILARTLSKTQALADEIRDRYGAEVLPLACDVASTSSLQAARDAVLARFGRIDVLVNGAGGNRPAATTGPDRSFFELEEQAIAEVFELNLTGTVLACQIFGAAMQAGGSIINIASMAGMRPLTNVAMYGAAKAAVINFTQWLSTWLCRNGKERIRVNAIAPGFFLTEQNRYLLTDKKTGEPTARGRHILAQTPMGRYGGAQELCGALIYLASDAASFVTGAVLPVDGGFHTFAI